MNKSFLDLVGLTYLWGKIKEYVASYSSLTTNSGTVTVNIGGNSSVVPTKTSQMTNDSGFITSADIPEGAAASTTTPKMDGTAARGTDNGFARGDHVHPTDTSRAADSAVVHLTGAEIITGDKTIMASKKLKLEDSWNQIYNADDSIGLGDVLNQKANLASPTFTGTPTAPTATAGTNTTQIATTAFVTAAVNAASAGVASFQGTVSDASTITGATYKKGWYWVVETAGTYVGQVCEAGDMIFAIKDKGSAYAAGDFSVVQNNMDIQEMTTAEMDTATNNWT